MSHMADMYKKPAQPAFVYTYCDEDPDRSLCILASVSCILINIAVLVIYKTVTVVRTAGLTYYYASLLVANTIQHIGLLVNFCIPTLRLKLDDILQYDLYNFPVAVCNTVSTYILVAFFFDRYIVLITAFQGNITPKATLSVIVSIIVVSFLYNFPRILVFYSDNNLIHMKQTQRYLKMIYYTTIYPSAIPMFLMSILIGLIIKRLKLQSSADFLAFAEWVYRLTFILTFFLICEGVSITENVVFYSWLHQSDKWSICINEELYDLSSMCAMSQSAINFILCYSFGKKFRDELRQKLKDLYQYLTGSADDDDTVDS